MKPGELIKVIKACKESGVEELRIEGIKVYFKKEHTTSDLAFNEPNHIAPKMSDEVKLELLKLEEKREEDLSSELLAVEDPEEWERQELLKLEETESMEA